MSKIAEVRASAHLRPLSGEFVCPGRGANTKRDCVVVRIIGDEGRAGWGEAHHGQNPPGMAAILQRGLGSLLTGSEVLASEVTWARLARKQIVTHGRGTGGIIALWDPKSKNMGGQPSNRLPGGAPKRAAYGWGVALGFKPPDALEAGVRKLVDSASVPSPMRRSARPTSAESIRSVPNSLARPIRWRALKLRRLTSSASTSIRRSLIGIRRSPAHVISPGADEQVATTGQ